MKATGRFVDVDFAVVAFKAEGEPFLGLPAIAALPSLVGNLAGQIIAEPIGCFGNQTD